MRIAGHDDHPFARFTCPSLTTVAQDYKSISKPSVETILNLVDGGTVRDSEREVLFEGRLVMRASA